MTSGAILDVARDGIVVFLKAGAPLMLIALGVGLVVSLFQALTQIQEQTLSFIPKIIAVVLTLIFLTPLFLTWVVEYMRETLELMFHGLGS